MQSKLTVVALILVLALPSAPSEAQPQQEKGDLYRQFELLTRLVHEIQDKYVGEVDVKKLFEDACKGMLTGLDPDSQFLSGESLNEFKTEADGQFGGLGIEIGIKDGVLSVLTPMRGSPAFRAGIMAGDRILRIDGKDTKEMALREAVGRLRGRPGGKITLTVLHEGAQTPEDIVLTRESIRVPTVQGARMVDDEAKIAYVHLTNLGEKTAEELDRAIKTLEQEGMKALVLDLRFNPGGVVTA
ncbi:MAG: PDZ domain-containing protein, partial [Planctomycetes bacterium]|nr:PDZ domain-containing protein [Planctomycetota bacterium]